MGIYVNPKSSGFARILSSGDYVDKTGLISFFSSRLNTAGSLVCSTRPRRFGKSFAVQMLTAYYSRGSDGSGLFNNLGVSTDPNFVRYLNQCDVIAWDTVSFLGRREAPGDAVDLLNRELCADLKSEFSEIRDEPGEDFPALLLKLCLATGRRFIFLIDEWDAIFRERADDDTLQRNYLEFLRALFKGNRVADTVAGVYMTGILPIKKYGTQSALTDFKEFTMVSPGPIAGYVGFTESEVEKLCTKHGMSLAEMRRWYDGYAFHDIGHVFCPNSVMNAVENGAFRSYWTQSEASSSLLYYLELNFDGLRDAVVSMLSGGRCFVEPQAFQNDMTSMRSRDDVLTLLVHLGYLGYDEEDQTVFIPNEEIRLEFMRSVKNSPRQEFLRFVQLSDAVLEATLRRQEADLASLIGKVHGEQGALRFYNNEQSLRAVVRAAYMTSVDRYRRIEEDEGGKGFIDMLFVPRKDNLDPALLVELKWDQLPEKALKQIRERDYAQGLKKYGYYGEVLLIAVSYDPRTKQHTCRIESAGVG